MPFSGTVHTNLFGTEVCKMHEEIIPSGLDFWGKTLGLKFTDLVACKINQLKVSPW